MSRIVAINGSPKSKESVSGMLIEKMEGFLGAKIDVHRAAQLIRLENARETIADILKADVVLIMFPLYVDGLPAPLVKLLTYMEQAASATNAPLPVAYAICNCGFYEAEHNRLALRMLRNFARRAGLGWGYGIGIGSGGFLLSASKSMEKGPAASIYAALQALGETVRDNGKKTHEDVFVGPKIPRFLYKMGGHMGWRQAAKKNGVQNQLRARPYS